MGDRKCSWGGGLLAGPRIGEHGWVGEERWWVRGAADRASATTTTSSTIIITSISSSTVYGDTRSGQPLVRSGPRHVLISDMYIKISPLPAVMPNRDWGHTS